MDAHLHGAGGMAFLDDGAAGAQRGEDVCGGDVAVGEDIEGDLFATHGP
jgi:hypothetical protein